MPLHSAFHPSCNTASASTPAPACMPLPKQPQNGGRTCSCGCSQSRRALRRPSTCGTRRHAWLRGRGYQRTQSVERMDAQCHRPCSLLAQQEARAWHRSQGTCVLPACRNSAATAPPCTPRPCAPWLYRVPWMYPVATCALAVRRGRMRRGSHRGIMGYTGIAAAGAAALSTALCSMDRLCRRVWLASIAPLVPQAC